MSNPGPSLNEIIDELREALEDPADLDEELRAELRGAAEEILEALDPDHERELSGSLRERLTDALERFERSCLLYTSPSPRDLSTSRMPSSA